MRIFMLCNVEIPMVSEALGKPKNVFGGWLDDVSRFLSKDNELTVCYMSNTNTYLVENRNIYAGFVESDFLSVFFKLLKENNYDIFHIWGTEYRHSYSCVSELEKRDLLNRCIVSIQGLVSVYAKHYAEGIPNKYLRRRTIKEWIHGNDILNGIEYFNTRGIDECELLRKVTHVIGRTTWDRACIQSINPDAIYHMCNENLRSCFYDDSKHWEYEHINKHTMFLSQCSYPVKGLHFLLKAMPQILSKYPDAKIITTGIDFINKYDYHIQDSYYNYIVDLVNDLGLKKHIIFKGVLSAEQMKDEYLSANVFVCPSTIENSPNSVGEAMITGCPVVASYVGGTMDMLSHDKEGYLYQMSSSEMLSYYICEMFGNIEKTILLSKSSREKAKITHDRQINNEKLLSIYQDILE